MVIDFDGYKVCISAQSKYTDEHFNDVSAMRVLNTFMVYMLEVKRSLRRYPTEENLKRAQMIEDEFNELYDQFAEKGFYND